MYCTIAAEIKHLYCVEKMKMKQKERKKFHEEDEN